MTLCWPPSDFWNEELSSKIADIVKSSGKPCKADATTIAIINFQVYDAEDRSDYRIKNRIKMRDRGWTFQVTKLPKKVLISDDDRVEFDNEEDCNAYNVEMLLFDLQREQEEEDKQWTEEYYRRRHDPYWKNHSDYD
jgi:hypothetical protein